MKLGYFIWMGILLCTIVFSSKRCYKANKYIATSQIKGVAIILVIFGHLSRIAGIDNSMLNLLGANGVCMFLLISGYGLYKSSEKKGITLSYWKKRLVTVIIPYGVITGIFLLSDMFFLNKEYSPIYILKNILGIDNLTRFDDTMWYIQFILSWYIIFGTVFYFKKLKDLRIGILFLFSIIFYSQMNRKPFSMYYYQCAVHSFSFPIGVLFGRYGEKLRNITSTKTNFIAINFITIILLYFIYGKINIDNNLYMLYNFCVAVIFISTILIAYNSNTYFHVLNYVGSISFYLYLFEGVFLYNYNIINKDMPLFSFFMYFFLITALSLLYKRLIESVTNKKNLVNKKTV